MELSTSGRSTGSSTREGPVSRKSLYHETLSHRAKLFKGLLDRVSSASSNRSSCANTSRPTSVAAGGSGLDVASTRGRYSDPSFSEEDYGYGSYDSVPHYRQHCHPLPMSSSSAPMMSSQGGCAMASRETEVDLEGPYDSSSPSPSPSLSPTIPPPLPSPSPPSPLSPSSPFSSRVRQVPNFASSGHTLESTHTERQQPLLRPPKRCLLPPPCYPVPTSIDYMKRGRCPEKPAWLLSPPPLGVAAVTAIKRKIPTATFSSSSDNRVHVFDHESSRTPSSPSFPPSLKRRHVPPPQSMQTAYDDSGSTVVTPAYTTYSSSNFCASSSPLHHHNSATPTLEPVHAQVKVPRQTQHDHYSTQCPQSSSSSLSQSSVQRLKLSSSKQDRSIHHSSGHHRTSCHSLGSHRHRTSRHSHRSSGSSRSLETLDDGCLESPRAPKNSSSSSTSFVVVESLESCCSKSLGGGGSTGSSSSMLLPGISAN